MWLKNSIIYFIEYNDDDVIIYIASSTVKHFDSNKTMSFKVTDNKLLKEYTKIWKKVINLMNIKSDSEPVYGDNDKYIKTKIKLYGDKINTNFQSKTPKNTKRKCII